MLKISQKLLYYYATLLLTLQVIWGSKNVHIGYQTSADHLIISETTCSVNNKNDISKEIKNLIKKNTPYTKGEHVGIYLMLPKKSTGSMVQELIPLNKVDEVKSKQCYIFTPALKLVYQKSSKKVTSFIHTASINEDNLSLKKATAASYFCQENHISWDEMVKDGKGGFISTQVIQQRTSINKLLVATVLAIVFILSIFKLLTILKKTINRVK